MTSKNSKLWQLLRVSVDDRTPCLVFIDISSLNHECCIATAKRRTCQGDLIKPVSAGDTDNSIHLSSTSYDGTACNHCSVQIHLNAIYPVLLGLLGKTSAEATTLAAGSAKNYLQAVSVHAPHPQRTSSTILVRLCIHSFCSQSQIPAEVIWLSGLRPA